MALMKIVLTFFLIITSYAYALENQSPDFELDNSWDLITINKVSAKTLKALSDYDKKATLVVKLSEGVTQQEFDSLLKNNVWIRHLRVNWNDGIHNIKSVSKLTSLQKLELVGLRLSENTPIDLEPLFELTSLRELDLKDTKIVTTKTLSGLFNLEKINFNSSHIDSLDFLKKTPNVKELSLHGEHNFTNYDPIATLKALELLNIDRNSQATDAAMVAFANLTNLKNVSILQNEKLTTINFLKRSRGIEELALTWCKGLKDVSALNDMSSLKTLKMSGVPIQNLNFLNNKPQLTELNISGTRVKELNTLSQIKTLRFLDIANTEITDIAPLLTLQLRSITLNAKVPDAQIRALRKSLPEASIFINTDGVLKKY